MNYSLVVRYLIDLILDDVVPGRGVASTDPLVTVIWGPLLLRDVVRGGLLDAPRIGFVYQSLLRRLTFLSLCSCLRESGIV